MTQISLNMLSGGSPFNGKPIIFCIKLSYHRSPMCQGRNIAFKISTFIPFSFMRSAKNEVLIPEPFMKISSSSLDFHKNGVPNRSMEQSEFMDVAILR